MKKTPALHGSHTNILLACVSLVIVVIMIAACLYIRKEYQQTLKLTQLSNSLHSQNTVLEEQKKTIEAQLAQVQTQYEELKSQDQLKRNDALQQELKDLHTTYQSSIEVYEDILQLGEFSAKLQPLYASYSAIINTLSKRDYTTASAGISSLKKEVQKRQAELATQSAITSNVAINNAAPDSGYRRQSVESDVGTFVVDIIVGDLNSTKVQVVTASDIDCQDSCPVSSLGDFVGRVGGYAGINGPYFCPAEYPSCAGKTNSFDTLLMNYKKTYFNSDNNVYSSVPAAIFSGNSGRVVSRSMDWGRDTGVDAVIAAQPLLLINGDITFGGDNDPKKGSRGSRSFIAIKENKVMIGVVRNATVAEVAHVLKKLGAQHALNLDSGGSTALMFNGKYLAGPGRNTPFGIVLTRK